MLQIDLSPTNWKVTPAPSSILTDSTSDIVRIAMARQVRKVFDAVVLRKDFSYETGLQKSQRFPRPFWLTRTWFTQCWSSIGGIERFSKIYRIAGRWMTMRLIRYCAIKDISLSRVCTIGYDPHSSRIIGATADHLRNPQIFRLHRPFSTRGYRQPKYRYSTVS